MDTDTKEISNNTALAVHIWNHCHNCGAAPIVGSRYHCLSCPEGPDNDLCERCREKLIRGEIKHPADDSPAAGMAIKDHRFEVLAGKPGTLYENWLPVKHPQAAHPCVPDHFVVRPIFSASDDAVIGGYAFAASLAGYRYSLLLTALHVLDGLIKRKGIDCTGNNKNYSGKELPAIISEVNIFDIFAPNWMLAPLGTVGPMLVLPQAGTGDEEPISYRDIAAFQVMGKDCDNLQPQALADRSPDVGEPVWLAAKLPGQTLQRSLKAVVVEKTDCSFVFKFEDNESERPKYVSGAPILDINGSVVGINVGGGNYKGQRFGHANHVENIRNHLSFLSTSKNITNASL